jgi:hypothetical protein
VEVHGPEPGRAGARVPERRFRRPVLARAYRVHAQARHRNLFTAAAVELRDVGHLGHLAQQPQELDAARLQIRLVEQRNRSEAQLFGELLDVLLDARRRPHRLDVLQAGQRRLVFLIRKVKTDRARGEQHGHHQGEDQQKVLAEQVSAVDVARGLRRERRLQHGAAAFPGGFHFDC